MVEIRDFACTYENSAGLNEEITRDLGLTFPEAHLHKESLLTLARATKDYEKTPFCVLPFCHTLEAESLGGIINLGNESTGPRAGGYIYTKLEELKDLPPMDLTKGRIHEMLLTARELVDSGETVVFEVCGPITVLSALIDPKHIFKGLRKQPDLVGEIFEKLGDALLEYVAEIKKQGVTLISYADVVGGVNILGPKMAGQVLELFTLPFVKKLEQLTDDHFTVLFCPKTTLALIDTGHAEYRGVPVDAEAGKCQTGADSCQDGADNDSCQASADNDSCQNVAGSAITYQEACVKMAGKVHIAGQMCIKNGNYKLKDGMIIELILLP